jgi:hypothetical protein
LLAERDRLYFERELAAYWRSSSYAHAANVAALSARP